MKAVCECGENLTPVRNVVMVRRGYVWYCLSKDCGKVYKAGARVWVADGPDSPLKQRDARVTMED